MMFELEGLPCFRFERRLRPTISLGALLGLALGVLLGPAVALAGEPSVIAPPSSGSGWATLWTWLLSTLGPMLLPVILTLLVALLGGLLHLVAVAISHLKAGRIRHYSLAIADGARQGVAYVEQVLRPQLPPDLSPEQARKLRDAAIGAALAYLKSFGLDAVKASLKLTDEQLGERLGVAIEAQVEIAKQAQPAPVPERPREIVPRPSGEGVIVRPVPLP